MREENKHEKLKKIISTYTQSLSQYNSNSKKLLKYHSIKPVRTYVRTHAHTYLGESCSLLGPAVDGHQILIVNPPQYFLRLKCKCPVTCRQLTLVCMYTHHCVVCTVRINRIGYD